jgi:hypothetical protein
VHFFLHPFDVSICIFKVVHQLFLNSIEHYHFCLDVQFLLRVVELVFLHLTNHLLELFLEDTVLLHVIVVVYHDHRMTTGLTEHVEGFRDFTHVLVFYTMVLDHTSEVLNNGA